MKNLIEKTKKLTSLLEELQIAKEEEPYQYKIKFEYTLGGNDVYSLYDRSNNKVKIDKLERLNSWINIRGISEEKIYRLQKI